MPFQKHARIALTNDGKGRVFSFYFNLDFRALAKPLPADTLYFHAQFRQAQPNLGWRSEEHTSELQSRLHLVCRLLLEKKKARESDYVVTLPMSTPETPHGSATDL